MRESAPRQVGQEKMAQEVSLAFPPALERVCVDLSGQDWLQSVDLDRAAPREIEAIEAYLDRQFPQRGAQFAHIGGGRFELMSSFEAGLLRAERELEFQIKRSVDIAGVEKQAAPAMENSVLFAGSGSRALGEKIAHRLGMEPGNILFGKFANGESRIVVNESVRDKHVFVIQSSSKPVNDTIVDLCLTADALKRASAKSITAVVPYFGYSRQDRKDRVRGPISARWVADMYEKSGIERVVTIDIHAEQIEGFFSRAMDNLAGFPLMVPHICQKYGTGKITVVSPDAGGMRRAEAAGQLLARHLVKLSSDSDPALDVAIRVEGMYKRRDKPNEVAESRLIGDGESVRGATCILVDDMIDTGGSSVKAAQLLRSYGAKHVVVCATHPIFSGACVERFRNASTSNGERVIDEVLVTDTLPLRRGKGDLITVISVERLLAEAVRRIAQGGGASLRELLGFCGTFDN